MTSFYRGVLILGILLLAVSGVFFVADSDNASARMPTQVFPRRLLRYPLAIGVALALIGAAGLAVN